MKNQLYYAFIYCKVYEAKQIRMDEAKQIRMDEAKQIRMDEAKQIRMDAFQYNESSFFSFFYILDL